MSKEITKRALHVELQGFDIDNNMYRVTPAKRPVSGLVSVPGSKSMTNRALLLAALGEGRSVLSGVLFSGDSRCFLKALADLGFKMKVHESSRKVEITGCKGKLPCRTGRIHVGSAGTAARFLTAMLALSDGTYEISCSEQMKLRPMEELFQALTEMGASFEYLEQEGHLPVRVKGTGGNCRDVGLDISRSTQFLSALLMTAPMTGSGIRIRISGEKKDGAYIRITRNMLRFFGVETAFDGECYEVPGGQIPEVGSYTIEPDVSAACYFYAAAALTGGEITVKDIHPNALQGDLKFLEVLGRMGCTASETKKGICLKGPADGVLKGVNVNMNDFSDQALTLAALAPFADAPTTIRNIGHIRGQECDRMQAIIQELGRCGIRCEKKGDGITIFPGRTHGAEIETYDDHRVAMAFSLLGLRTEGIMIKNPMCCKKTFEDFFPTLEKIMIDS